MASRGRRACHNGSFWRVSQIWQPTSSVRRSVLEPRLRPSQPMRLAPLPVRRMDPLLQLWYAVGRNGAWRILGQHRVLDLHDIISAGRLVGAAELGLGGVVILQGSYLPEGRHIWLAEPLEGTPPIEPQGRLAEMQAAEPALHGLFPYALRTAQDDRPVLLALRGGGVSSRGRSGADPEPTRRPKRKQPAAVDTPRSCEQRA